jgi:hypothetical protein
VKLCTANRCCAPRQVLARKQIGYIEGDVMLAKLIEELRMSAYEIVKKPGTTGHALNPP